MTYYGTRFGCRFGQPHDMQLIHDGVQQKWERCAICGVTKRWNKGYHGRVDNAEYLRFHLRNYAQKGGPTNRVFMKLYEQEKATIYL